MLFIGFWFCSLVALFMGIREEPKMMIPAQLLPFSPKLFSIYIYGIFFKKGKYICQYISILYIYIYIYIHTHTLHYTYVLTYVGFSFLKKNARIIFYTLIWNHLQLCELEKFTYYFDDKDTNST